MSLVWKIEDGIEQTIAMKINESLAFPEKIRLKKAVLYTFNPKPRDCTWKDGTGRVSKEWSFPTWMRVYDDEGLCGEGPVSPVVWTVFVPMMLADGHARSNLDWRKIFYWKVRGDASAFIGMTQLEMILFDLIARRRGVPMHRLLGATRDWCDAYKGGGSVLRSDTELVEELLSFKEAGFRATKFKISLCDVERDLRRLELVRKALGEDFKIAVDSNQAWDAGTCMEFVRGAHPYHVEWYEEPVQAQEMDELTLLARRMRDEGREIPIAMGESARHFSTFQSYVQAGVRVLQPLPALYSLAEVLRVMEYGRAHGCRITCGQGYLPGVLIGAPGLSTPPIPCSPSCTRQMSSPPSPPGMSDTK